MSSTNVTIQILNIVHDKSFIVKCEPHRPTALVSGGTGELVTHMPQFCILQKKKIAQ